MSDYNKVFRLCLTNKMKCGFDISTRINIPGHGVFLSIFGHLVVWMLKSFLILTLGIIFSLHKKNHNKGYNGQHQWAKGFKSCQAYWALFSAAAKSYKHPIRKYIGHCSQQQLRVTNVQYASILGTVLSSSQELQMYNMQKLICQCNK